MARRIDLKDQAPPEPTPHKPALRFALFADSDLPVRGVVCDDTCDKFRQALKLTEDERELHKTWTSFEATGETLDLALAPYDRWLGCNPSGRWADLDEVQECGRSDTVYRAHLVGLSREDRVPLIAIRGYDADDTSCEPNLMLGAELVTFTEFQRRYGPVSKIEQTVWLPLNRDRVSSITKEVLAIDATDFQTLLVPTHPNLTGLVINAAVQEIVDEDS